MLTVAILNYNGMDTLRESIQSVLEQTLKPERFVVIDNASKDASRQVAVDIGIEIVDADNRFQFITGLNVALSLNQDRLFFMQNDVVLYKDCLREMILNAPGSNFIAQPVIYDTNGNIDNSGMDIYWPGFGQRRRSEKFGPIYKNFDAGLVTTICFLTDNKTVFYDESFAPAYYEDLDFYLRTRKMLKHILIPTAKVIHEGNHTFSQTLKKKEISAICRRNRKKFINKNYRGFDRFLRLTVTTCLDVVKKPFDVIRNWRIMDNNVQ